MSNVQEVYNWSRDRRTIYNCDLRSLSQWRAFSWPGFINTLLLPCDRWGWLGRVICSSSHFYGSLLLSGWPELKKPVVVLLIYNCTRGRGISSAAKRSESRARYLTILKWITNSKLVLRLVKLECMLNIVLPYFTLNSVAIGVRMSWLGELCRSVELRDIHPNG